jgi:hypothetical protein
MKRKVENATDGTPKLPQKTYDANTGGFRQITLDERVAFEQRANRRRNRGAVEAADWREADATKILDAITAVCRYGFAIRFGYTKDGGAFAVGIIGDGDAFTEFTRPSEDIDLYLDSLSADYRQYPDNEFSASRSQ